MNPRDTLLEHFNKQRQNSAYDCMHSPQVIAAANSYLTGFNVEKTLTAEMDLQQATPLLETLELLMQSFFQQGREDEYANLQRACQFLKKYYHAKSNMEVEEEGKAPHPFSVNSGQGLILPARPQEHQRVLAQRQQGLGLLPAFSYPFAGQPIIFLANVAGKGERLGDIPQSTVEYYLRNSPAPEIITSLGFIKEDLMCALGILNNTKIAKKKKRALALNSTLEYFEAALRETSNYKSAKNNFIREKN